MTGFTSWDLLSEMMQLVTKTGLLQMQVKKCNPNQLAKTRKPRGLCWASGMCAARRLSTMASVHYILSQALFLTVWHLSHAGFLLLLAKLAAVIPQLASEKRATSLSLSKHHILQKDCLGHMNTFGPLTRLGLGHMPSPVAGPECPLIDSPHEPLEVGGPFP